MIKKRLTLLITAILLLNACERKYEAPLLVEPTVDGVEATITIAELKERYQELPDKESREIEVDHIIRGIINANDISGNIFKQIYIQDSTGGISIGCDQSSIAQDYYIGQEVYIKLHGLAAVRYGGQLQIGWLKTNANRIPYEIFKARVVRNGWPKSEKVKPRIITLDQLNDRLLGTLIQIDGVYFEGGGELPYAEPQKTVNRYLYDSQSRSIIARNSGYADFGADIMPEGTGSVIGVLSKFGNDYQLFFRSKADIFNFKQEGGGGQDENGNELQGITVLSEDFSSGLGSFTTYSVAGNQAWQQKSYNEKCYAYMSGFESNASHANEDWLISPPLDLTDAKAAILTFNHAINKGEPQNMPAEQTLHFSLDYHEGAPTTATWEEVKIPSYPSGTDWRFVSSGEISLPSSYLGQKNVRFAFKYTCGSESSAAWEIAQVELKK